MTKRNLSELIVKQIPIENVHAYENNPRKNDQAVDAVALSIERYGFKQPCVVDEEMILVVGHTRYKAALKLGLKTIPCVVAADLTPEEVREYRILDNKLNELAEWDFGKLGEELDAMPDFDFAEFGIDFGFITNTENAASPKPIDESVAKNISLVTCP
jgi:site-specific DNA-methyltransferase (adenine-specific)